MAGRARTRGPLRVLWLIAVLTVVIGSLLPSDSRPIEVLERLPLSDKAEHFGMYAVVVFLPAIHERRRFVIATAICAAALGVGLEFVQRFTGWREFEVLDMAADTIGVCAGLAAGLLIRPRVRIDPVIDRR